MRTTGYPRFITRCNICEETKGEKKDTRVLQHLSELTRVSKLSVFKQLDEVWPSVETVTGHALLPYRQNRV